MEVGLSQLFGPLSLISLLFVRSTSARCFLPNGTDRNTLRGTSAGDYLPCDATAKVSMCCALGREDNADTCLAGGLCRDARGVHWRESCTDKTWKSSDCVKLFVEDVG